MTLKLVVALFVLVSCCCHGGQAMDCEAEKAEETCKTMKKTLGKDIDACKKCIDSKWKNTDSGSPDEADSAATPASAPGWEDDEQPQGRNRNYGRGRQQGNYGRSNYGRQGGQGYGDDYGNGNNNGYGNNGYGNGGYGNGGNGGYSNGGYGNNDYNNGYSNDNGYNQMSSNINYRPPVQRYNMGYGGRYRK
ncbi:hypothetical protein HDE_10017 [Halotydeus destructor]|nr:hypothetical protein HDE_10017 [Halotydeus destructor]